MPREERMFGDVVDPSSKMGNRQGASVALTILLESVLVGVFIVVPLMATDILPTSPEAIGAFVTTSAPPPPPPPPPAPAAQERVVEINQNAAPTEAPENIPPEPPETTIVERDNSDTGVPDGVPFSPSDRLVVSPPPAPPAPPAPPPPVRVGGIVRVPKKVTHVAPVYPPLALAARVSDYVIVEATIGKNGKVEDARILRSSPLLDQAALDAVRQWEFTPTLLNDEPTAVLMSVTVTFRLR